MKKINIAAIAAVAAVFVLSGVIIIKAATTVNLSTADGFAVLSGATITNTGPTVVNGDLGLSPGTSVTGFPPGAINGVRHVADPAAVQAKNDLSTAYTNAAGATPAATIPAELGGTTKTGGVYNSADGTFVITGTLTLNAEGDPNTVFIFKTASTLKTAGASNVVLMNGAQACNVFWQVGSSATLGTNSTFKGSILALTSATLTTGANVEGRVLAQNGAVTLDSNTVTKPTCAVAPPSAPAPTSTPPVIIVAPAPTSTPIIITPTPTSTPVTGLPTVVCTPIAQTALVGKNVSFTASGGNNSYTWYASDLRLITPFGAGFTANYGIAGNHVVTVTSNGQSANCSANILASVTPGLPNTGFAPQEKSISWIRAAVASILGFLKVQ